MTCISEILDDPENVYKRYKIDITDVGYYTWRRPKEHLNEQPFGIRISRSIQWDHLFNTCYMLKTATHFSKFFYTSLRYRCACSINIYVLRFFFKDKLVVTILLFFSSSYSRKHSKKWLSQLTRLPNVSNRKNSVHEREKMFEWSLKSY